MGEAHVRILSIQLRHCKQLLQQMATDAKERSDRDSNLCTLNFVFIRSRLKRLSTDSEANYQFLATSITTAQKLPGNDE